MAMRNTFGTIASGAQEPGSALDADFNDMGQLMGITQCAATGTNAITLAPAANQPTVSSPLPANQQMFNFVAAATSTGNVTAQVTNGGNFVPVFLPSGIQAGNGSIVSANPYIVMFLSALNSGAGGLAIVGGAPVTAQAIPAGSFKNLKLVGSGTGVTITADELAVEDTSGNMVKLTTVNQAIAWTTSGAGGLDTGVFAGNNWYYHWVIYNSTTVTQKAITSLSATAPTMPAGFTFKARVGAVFSLSATKAWHVQQYGRRAQIIMDGTDLTGLPSLASGVAGNVSTPTWVAVATGNFVPTTAGRITGALVATNNGSVAAMVAPNNSYGAITSTTNPPPCAMNTAAATFVTPFDFALESSNIFWASNAAAGALFSTGWEDNL